MAKSFMENSVTETSFKISGNAPKPQYMTSQFQYNIYCLVFSRFTPNGRGQNLKQEQSNRHGNSPFSN